MIDIDRKLVIDKLKELQEERRNTSDKDTSGAGPIKRVRKFFEKDEDFSRIEISFLVRQIMNDRALFEVIACGLKENYLIGTWDDYEEKMIFCEPSETGLVKRVCYLRELVEFEDIEDVERGDEEYEKDT